jgi:uncharacterized protein YfiM (DUF2279 family)
MCAFLYLCVCVYSITKRISDGVCSTCSAAEAEWEGVDALEGAWVGGGGGGEYSITRRISDGV